MLLYSCPELRCQEIQNDSLSKNDTVTFTTEKVVADSAKTRYHSPKKATIYSMVIPGLGQVYNRKYWKAAVVYAGVGVCAYLINFNHKNYKTFRDAYNIRTDGDTNTRDNYTYYSADNLKVLRDYYRRNLELTYIFSTLLYIANILDAAVDAHLWYYDVSDDLSLKIDPFLLPTNKNNYFAGLKITFNIK